MRNACETQKWVLTLLLSGPCSFTKADCLRRHDSSVLTKVVPWGVIFSFRCLKSSRKSRPVFLWLCFLQNTHHGCTCRFAYKPSRCQSRSTCGTRVPMSSPLTGLATATSCSRSDWWVLFARLVFAHRWLWLSKCIQMHCDGYMCDSFCIAVKAAFVLNMLKACVEPLGDMPTWGAYR